MRERARGNGEGESKRWRDRKHATATEPGRQEEWRKPRNTEALSQMQGNGIRAKAACACSGGGREAVNGPAAENNVGIISETGTDGKQSERVGV